MTIEEKTRRTARVLVLSENMVQPNDFTAVIQSEEVFMINNEEISSKVPIKRSRSLKDMDINLL